MTYAYTATERKRVSFGKIPEAMELPNLISVQRESFERFKDEGLREAFKESSPIQSQNHVLEVTFGEHQFGDPAHTVEECREKDMTYQAPLLTDVRLTNKETGEIKEQLVFMGDFPMMTDQGTFIINGTERIVVSQLVRSPGVYYSSEMDSGKQIYKAQIIPSRGAWLEFEVDKRDQLMVSIDRKRKQSATMFLRALGIAVTNDDIIELLGNSDVIKRTLERDTALTREDALIEIYRRLRPGEPPTVDASRSLLEGLLFNPQRYDLARVGRYKVNKKLNLTTEEEVTVLTDEDIVATLRYLLSLAAGEQGFKVDDIDHFGNRRIRTVGELVANQFRIGMSRMERVVRERMSSQDIDEITPQSLINIRPIVASIKEFFGSSQLSQFMDQANPLTGLTHKRRLSALGPGGLAGHKSGSSRRTNVPTAVRDVHNSHYSRMCPIETPEGPNIGLIGSLALYARVNEYGFIEAPFRRVENGVATDQIDWMTADEEEKHVIAPANTPLDPKTNEFITTDAEGKIVRPHTVIARTRDFDGSFGAPADVPVEDVDYMDVSPRQMLSVAATLIPFLEHDDAKRTLMGANMQRQAVPLIESERPLVGTGAEWRAAVDSGDVILAEKPGVVTYVSADIIRTMNDDGTTSSYKLAKFQRSNQTTCYNQVPLIHDGERVEAGTVLADGPATQKGEMALGKNLLIAFMPWNGYNYEDAVIISQRLVQDDTLSSIHIEEYEIDARETKLGAEEITRDLPNVGEDAVANLDERGIIRIGAEVEAGDILVGKVTPKGETELTPEERLLRAIFGEKSREVRDTSLRVPHGETGTVIAVKEITREDAEEDGDELPNGVNQMIRVYIAQHRKITQGDKLSGRHGNKGVISRILPEEDMPFLADGTPVDIMLNPLGVPSRMNLGQVLELHLGWIAHAGWDISLDPDAEAAWKKYVPQGAEKGAPGTPVATPVFDGVRPETIKGLLSCTLPDRDGNKLVGPDGKATLFDGRTGEPFPKPISVGYMYMLKLHHLVDDKIHARSTGPYSMITQQPLGGKAQFGGQRFGEMEVWALEAYGAAYTLHEMMTTKSDDVDGRVRVYGAIVKGENLPPAGIPESFKVLLKEMQSLSLNVEVLNAEGVAIDMKDEDDDPSTSSDDLGFNIGARPDAAAKEDQVAEEPEFQ